MDKQLISKIIEIKKLLKEQDGVKRKLNNAQESMLKKDQELSSIMHAMNMEAQDVKRLETLSLTSIYHSLLGDKEVQMNKEQSEYLSAKLKYDSAVSQIESLKSEISAHKKQVQSHDELTIELKELESKVMNALGSSGDMQASRVINDLVSAESELKELREARRAGDKALSTTNEALHLIEKAQNWGVIDMVGGGFLTTMAKHSNLSGAKAKMEMLSQDIETYHRELQDINLSASEIEINVGAFLSFADFVLDGIIFDWMVQSKISKTKRKLEQLANEIKTIQSSLNLNISEAKKSYNSFEQQQKDQIDQLLVI